MAKLAEFQHTMGDMTGVGFMKMKENLEGVEQKIAVNLLKVGAESFNTKSVTMEYMNEQIGMTRTEAKEYTDSSAAARDLHFSDKLQEMQAQQALALYPYIGYIL